MRFGRRAASILSDSNIIPRVYCNETETTDLRGLTAVQARFEFERAWGDLHRRDLILRLVALSFLPGVAVLILLTNWAYGDVPWDFGRWVGGGWIAVFVAAGIYRRFFRCPGCHQLFFGWGFSHKSNVCAHCGLTVEWSRSNLSRT